MSATAFQRHRRELESKQQASEVVQNAESNYDDITKKELSDLLDSKGIEHSTRANKEELVNLLKGVE